MDMVHISGGAGRLSHILKTELHISTGLMNRLKWNGGLRVNGESVHTDYPVTPGDVITLALDEPEPEYPAQEGQLHILYEDPYLLAVDKPAGMLIHPSRARMEDTLANYVVGYYQKMGQHSAFHPLTRLDRDTFGVVLLAKNAYIHARLQHCGAKKAYQALTYGAPAADVGTVEAPIARKPLPSLLREIRPDGKPSVTEYRVLDRGNPVCRLELNPLTGRTHQLRLHCAWMGCPILGDPQYGSAESIAYSQTLGLTGQMLWAYRLELNHPVTGKSLTILSEMESVFCQAAR